MLRQCKNNDCSNTALPRRTECSSCRYNRYKQENPVRIAYDSSKSSAKRRNKEFSLTKEQYSEFCVRTKYLELKGIYKTSYHIDRIDEEKGYTKDNIQILQNPDNVRKYRKYVDTINNKKIFTTVTAIDTMISTYGDDCPF